MKLTKQAKQASISSKAITAMPYGLMWYGNLLASPYPDGKDEEGNPVPGDVLKRSQMRALAKGLVYSGAGITATKALFPDDFRIEKSKKNSGLWGKLKTTFNNHFVQKGKACIGMNKAASYLIKEAINSSKE